MIQLESSHCNAANRHFLGEKIPGLAELVAPHP